MKNKKTTRKLIAPLVLITILGLSAHLARAGLITNGSFETPSAASVGGAIEIYAGSEPSDFAWKVNSGTVEVVHQGYVGGNGTFNGAAYEGQQWLDLDGISPGSVSQTFATTPGVTYNLTFAYANNPYLRNNGPAQATVSVSDSGSGASLISPVSISHGSSTADNYQWSLSGVITFTATGSSTTLSFTSNDPVNSDAGILLDKIRVSVGTSSFFDGAVALSQGVYYLAFSANGNVFGYYSFLTDPHYIYHFDLGYEYVFDAADGKAGVYLYDFKSQHFFYTSPGFPFPYLYDFSLNAVLYYYPDPNNPGRYNTNGVRYFYNFATSQIITE